MADQSNIVELPSDAIRCIGPYFYDRSRYIAPNGDLYKVSKNGTIRIQSKIRNGKIYNWTNAVHKSENESIATMSSIDSIYNGKHVKPEILVAYYFVEKVDFAASDVLRVEKIHESLTISPENIRWVKSNDSNLINSLRSEVSDLQKQLEQLLSLDSDNDEKMCLICCSAIRQSVLVPCGHHVMCMKCSDRFVASTNIVSCPICRAEVIQFVKLQIA